MVSEGDFVQAGQAVNLTAAGRKRFFQAYEQRMSALLTHPVFDYKVSYRRALELQARLLAKVLTGEIPEYVPLILIRFQDEPNSGRVLAWQDHAGLIHSLLSVRN
jgi:CRISPR-associated protein Cas1